MVKEGARLVGGGLVLESGSCSWGCGPNQYLEIRGCGGAVQTLEWELDGGLKGYVRGS